jgi:hypothetical protein
MSATASPTSGPRWRRSARRGSGSSTSAHGTAQWGPRSLFSIRPMSAGCSPNSWSTQRNLAPGQHDRGLVRSFPGPVCGLSRRGSPLFPGPVRGLSQVGGGRSSGRCPSAGPGPNTLLVQAGRATQRTATLPPGTALVAQGHHPVSPSDHGESLKLAAMQEGYTVGVRYSAARPEAGRQVQRIRRWEAGSNRQRPEGRVVCLLPGEKIAKVRKDRVRYMSLCRRLTLTIGCEIIICPPLPPRLPYRPNRVRPHAIRH